MHASTGRVGVPADDAGGGAGVAEPVLEAHAVELLGDFLEHADLSEELVVRSRRRWPGLGLRAEAGAEEAHVDAEVVDLRTLLPVDMETIEASVKKTGRCLILHEATKTSGYGAELLSLVQEHCFWHLAAPIQRVTGWDTPYPHAFEWHYFPGPARLAKALTRLMED